MDDRAGAPPGGGVARRGLIGWALYDWANSPFSTLIITFVFPVYFGRAIVGDESEGLWLWQLALGLSGVAIALLSPILGGIADAGGRRKPWLFAFAALCIIATALLWYAEPGFLVWAIVCVIVANLAFEFGIVFNNAMLPDLVPPARLGRWSGWAWGIGYFGGIAALLIALFGFVQTEHPWFGLDEGQAVRVIGPLAAVWFAAFIWPLFAYTPDRPAARIGIPAAVVKGLSTLVVTLRNVRKHRNVARFLLARMIYTDGLNTVFVSGGAFAAAAFGMPLGEVIQFGILLNVTAGLGAVGFAWIDDWIGPKRTIIIALAGILVTGIAAISVRDVFWFWVAGAAFGAFLGPAQAASRSLMALLALPELRTEFFGLYALSGKATAFAALFIAGLVGRVTDERTGLATAIVFIAAGLALFFTVREPPREPEQASDQAIAG